MTEETASTSTITAGIDIEAVLAVFLIPYVLDVCWSLSAIAILVPMWRQDGLSLGMRLSSFLCLTLGGPHLLALVLGNPAPFLLQHDLLLPYLATFFCYHATSNVFDKYVLAESSPLSKVVDAGQAVGTVMSIIFLGFETSLEHSDPAISQSWLACIALGVLSTAGGAAVLAASGVLPSFNRSSNLKEFLIGSSILASFYYLLTDPHQTLAFPVSFLPLPQDHALLATIILYICGCNSLLAALVRLEGIVIPLLLARPKPHRD